MSSSAYSAEMRHAKVQMPKFEGHAKHPFKDAKNHESLLQYLRSRLTKGRQARDGNLDRLVRVDKEFSGWMKKDLDDKRREEIKEQTGYAQAQQMNLPVTFIHLDDMMTYFAATFAPSRGMFYHTADSEDTGPAAQVVSLMNNDAIYAGYFREVLMGIYSLLKYNRGGFHVFWGSDTGPKLTTGEGGETRVEQEIKWKGNRLEALDPYNLFCDTSVPISKVHSEGEYAAMACIKSHYWLQNKASQGVYYNVEEALKTIEGESRFTYYRSPPQEADMDQDDSKGNNTDWMSILSERSTTHVGPGHELVECYIRLNPTEFGLLPANESAGRSRYELWRITILNDMYIIDAQYMNNVHGHIPYYMGYLNDDLMGASQKSVAEILSPLQEFSSFLLNLHIVANRKNVWGRTYYDPTMVDLAKVKNGSVVAEIPVEPAAFGKDIRTFIHRDQNTLDTKQTLQDLQGIMGIIDQFFPTQSLPSQIASIDRAVDSQVAAVQQGANRRQQKTARLLDESIFRNVRYSMYYNLIQYTDDSKQATDFYTNQKIDIDLNELRDTDLPFIIGQGLKAIDRQSAAASLQNIIFALIQAPQAAQGIDLLRLIDYWTSMMDVDIDMTQFRIEQPPEGQPAQATDEEGNPINPATNPSAVTTPIFG